MSQPMHDPGQPKLWLALVVVVVLSVVGCAAPLPQAPREARWDGSDTFQALPLDYTSEPSGRAGARELWIRIDVPPMPGVSDPALAFPFDFRGLRDFRYGLVEIVEDDTRIADGGGGAVIPLLRAGAPVLLHYRSDEPIHAPRVFYGSEAVLTSRLLDGDIGRFSAASLFILSGCLLLVSAVRRGHAREVTALGLYLVCTGLPQMAECGELRHIVVPSSPFWFYVFGSTVFLFPAAFASFVELTFAPGGRDRILTVLRYACIALLAATFACHFLSILDLENGRRLADLCIVAVALRTVMLLLPRVRRGPFFVRIFFASFSLGSLFLTHDILIVFGLLPYGRSIAYVGGVILTGGMALALEARFQGQRDEIAHARARLEAQLRELEEKHTEVEALNADLREQISARSREISKLVDGSRDLVRYAAGTVVDRRYRILRSLGEGGMGKVFAVARIRDDKPFALKIMREGARWEDAVRFMREAQIAASLHHPNLVSVVDVGIDHGTIYIVMELVKGHTLEDDRGHFGDRSWALPILHEVAAGLAVLHDQGVLHRDLKPSNVLISDSGPGSAVPKISDFGLARVEEPVDEEGATVRAGSDPERAAEQRRVTMGSAVVGTPAYLAPESAHGSRDLSRASDVFSFGVMAYEMLTGRYPFHLPPIHQATLERPSPEGLDPSTADLLTRCMAPIPSDRPSVKELVRAFA